MEHIFWLSLLFFGVAFLYASVGFGGGSSYLALLAIAGIGYTMLRPTALTCNLVVVSGASILYIRAGILPWKKVLPLVALSVPFAALGGYIQLDKAIYMPLLGTLLLLAAACMLLQQYLLQKSNADAPHPARNTWWHLIAGAAIGLLSGLVGIGGGIFLAPLLHLSRWDSPRKIAATASFFILVNSIAGLGGLLMGNSWAIDWQLLGLLALAVFAGGQLGSRLILRLSSPGLIRVMTALLVAFIGGRLLLL